MNKEILKLAIPNILSNLAIPMLGVVDTALVGHMEGLTHIGSVALGTMIFNFVYWGLGFLRMGTTGLTAQAVGAKNRAETMHQLIRALVVALILSVLLILFQKLLLWFSFLFIDSTPEIKEHTSVYFYIRIYAAPATLGLYAFHGWFLGKQNAKYPLILTLVINIANIGFNLLFVKRFGMYSDGLALGTVCAQYLGFFIAIFLFLKRYRASMKDIIRKRLWALIHMKAFFSVNRDIFIRTLTLIFSFSFFTAQSAKMGEEMLAVNTILLQLWMVFSYGIDGFAYAAESIVGKYKGAADSSRFKEVIGKIFNMGVALGILFSLLFLFWDKAILGLFTDKEKLIQLALLYMPWTVAAPVINSFCYIWDGIYIGSTATVPMRNTMLFSTFVVFLPAYYAGVFLFGNHGIWLAMILFMVARALGLHLYAKRYIYTF